MPRILELHSELLGKFTYDAYTRLLQSLRKAYKIVPFREVRRTKPPYLILRHDVDASLESALAMANLEHRIGVKSTYLVLFSHRIYNLFEEDSFLILRRIRELGHEIGLHYDLNAYRQYAKSHSAYRKQLENEAGILGSWLRTRVVTIARHNPDRSMDPLRDVRAFINAYDKGYFELYVSDSCKAWDFAAVSRLLHGRYCRVQLLIHPALWSRSVHGREATLRQVFDKASLKDEEYLDRWLQMWRRSSRLKEYDRVMK